jgi:hypothetical protein
MLFTEVTGLCVFDVMIPDIVIPPQKTRMIATLSNIFLVSNCPIAHLNKIAQMREAVPTIEIQLDMFVRKSI